MTRAWYAPASVKEYISGIGADSSQKTFGSQTKSVASARTFG